MAYKLVKTATSVEQWLSDADAARLERPVKSLMQGAFEDYRDPATGEVKLTVLAEFAAAEFDVYGDDPEATIPQDLFQWAFEVSEEAA